MGCSTSGTHIQNVNPSLILGLHALMSLPLWSQLLSGRDNQLARACAQGTVDEDAPIMAALAHDLEVLQVSESACENLSITRTSVTRSCWHMTCKSCCKSA
jgi:hypothetical protein